MSVTSLPQQIVVVALIWVVAACSPGTDSSPLDGTSEIINEVAESDLSVEAESSSPIDELPPYLAISTPEWGAILESGEGFKLITELWDESPLSTDIRLTSLLSGEVSKAAPAKIVELSLDLPPGLQLVQVEATDTAGMTSREHRAVRAGPFGPCESSPGIPDMAWDVGNNALAVGGEFIAGLIASLDLVPYLIEANPVFQENGVTVNLETLDLLQLTVHPVVANNQLTATVSLYEVATKGTIQLEGFPAPYVFYGSISDLQLQFWLTAVVNDGTLVFQVDDLKIDAGQILLTAWNDEGEEIVAPTAVDGAFLDFVTDTLAETLVEWVNGSSEAAEAWLTGTFTFEFMDHPFDVEYAIIGIDILQTRLRLGFHATVDLPDAPDGCVPRTFAPPPASYEDDFDVSAWFSIDFLNRLLQQLWAMDILAWTVDQAFVDSMKLELDLVAGLMGDHLRLAAGGIPPETPLTLQADLMMPPEFQALQAGLVDEEAGPGLIIGGMRLRPYAGTDTTGTPFANLYLSVAAALRADIHNNSLLLSPSIPAFALDVGGIPEGTGKSQFDMKRLVELEVEGHIETLLPDTLHSVAGALLAIPLPEAGGISLVQGELAAQDDPGYLRISGTVAGAKQQ
jgi:hypothetical protein